MFQTTLWCYLWDLVDEGIDEVLDRLKGQAGVTAIIQPGGSRNDEQAIATCNEHEMAMVFTGVRHFRH